MARILTPEHLRGLRGRISIDVETFGGHAPHLGTLAGLGVWCEDSSVIGYVPGDQAEDLRDVIVNTWEPGSWLIAHNLTYELRWLLLTPEDTRRFRLFDTMVADHLINENPAHSLEACEARYLGRKTKQSLLRWAKEEGHKISKVETWPTELLADYCVNDVAITYHIAQAQAPLLRSEGVERLMGRQMEYLRVIHGAEQRGMYIDGEALEATEQKLDRLISEMDVRWARTLRTHGINREVNYRSAQQLSTLLYDDLGLEKPSVPEELKFSPKANKYTSTSTGKDILKKLNHPIASQVLRIKQLHKIHGYVKGYRKLGEDTGDGLIIRPNFNMTGTVTGRLSSSDPNMQQVPSKPIAADIDPDGTGVDTRAMFHARPGYVLAAIDYQQMEAVVFGLRAQDPTMLKLIRKGGDIHALTAELLFGTYDEAKRKVTKTLNFGLLYGLGRPGLAEMLGVPLEEAERLMAAYLELFPRVRPYMGEVERKLAKLGYIRYWSGRKRRITEKRFFYRGLNSEIQGGCADALGEAAIRTDELLRRNGGHLLALIHDEMVMEIPDGTQDTLVPQIQETMSIPDVFGLPLRTDAEVGTYWKSG